MKYRTMLAALLAGFLATSSKAIPDREVRIDSARFATLPANEQQRVMELKNRLEGLIATDRSSLDRNERRALRAEWRMLKGEMKEANRGGTVIYISTAGIIIIILLLIILL